MSLVPLPETLPGFLEPFFPPNSNLSSSPFVTLSYAQSLDSRIAAAKGTQTAISHLETKTMTHYIRSKHDAILVGIGTVAADDPKLNCRYLDKSTIRPVIVDPRAQWHYAQSQLCGLARAGNGLAPYILVDVGATPREEDKQVVAEQGGQIVEITFEKSIVQTWTNILDQLSSLGIESVMVEGGARIINDLLSAEARHLVDALIITVGPVFLGSQGVEVSPASGVQLEDVKWWTGTRDSVVAARVKSEVKSPDKRIERREE